MTASGRPETESAALTSVAFDAGPLQPKSPSIRSLQAVRPRGAAPALAAGRPLDHGVVVLHRAGIGDRHGLAAQPAVPALPLRVGEREPAWAS